MEKNIIDWVALVLTIIGGLNLGLEGIAQWNLISILLGPVPMLERVIYILIGLSAVYLIYSSNKK